MIARRAPIIPPTTAPVLGPVMGGTISVVVSGGPVVEMNVVVPGVKEIFFYFLFLNFNAEHEVHTN